MGAFAKEMRHAYFKGMIDDLYSTRILGLAANMPRAGRLETPQGTGERVAKLCGSRAVVDVVLDDRDRIADFAQEVKACALGQAAAGVLGETVIGATIAEIADARDAMLAMLKTGGEGPTGRFEGLRVLKQVADYPARHASTMVAIEATLEAVRQATNGAHAFAAGAAQARVSKFPLVPAKAATQFFREALRWTQSASDPESDRSKHWVPAFAGMSGMRSTHTLYERGVRLAHRGYKVTLSPFFGQSCRFLPTCSDYGRDALIAHGPVKGGWLTLRRVCKCHPWGGSGYDPVPPLSDKD